MHHPKGDTQADFIRLDETGDVGTLCIAPDVSDSLLLTGDSQGDTPTFTLSRLNSDGSEKLLATHSFGDDEELFFGLSAHVSPDQTIFLAGALWGDDLYPAVARMKATGPLDTSFGDHGVRIFRDLTASRAPTAGISSHQKRGAKLNATHGSPSHTTRVVLPDGGYLVASAETGYLLRITHDGELDASFAGGGKLLPTPPGVADFELTNATLRGDNIILLIGNSGSKGIVASYDLSGQPTDGFLDQAVVEIEHEEGVNLRNLSFSPDGKVLNIVGMTYVSGQRRGLLARIDAYKGSADAMFNNGQPFHLTFENQETSFLQVASRLNQDQEERIYAVGGRLAFPTPGYIAAAFDKRGLANDDFLDGVATGTETTMATSVALLQAPPRLVIGGGVRRKDSGDSQGFVAIHPLSA
ncbi:hypothetical protein E2H86_03365 [Pseudomonas putida]|uniref:hypothetical protein n=1 Tax=Pseudomonas putida TaxID=303 RepID=UPI00105A54C8|nr:hypothetical protein [Pseudomonas putida]TDJ78651.1 hypothetical protein E2H86_03365 [Pseudomonas putida]